MNSSDNIEMTGESLSGIIQSGLLKQTPIWDAGIHGENQIIGIIDTAVDLWHCFFRDIDHIAACQAHRKVVGYKCNPLSRELGVDHGTIVAGIALGDDRENTGKNVNRGVAFGSRMTFIDKAILDQRYESTRMFGRLNSSKVDGAFIHCNSWIQNNSAQQYNDFSLDIDKFMWENEDHLVLASASTNEDEIRPPGSSKNCLCVGATQGYPNHMTVGDSAKGPTKDGRRKPDVMILGCSIVSVKIKSRCEVFLQKICASSWATAAMAGSAALVRQYFVDGFYPTGRRNSLDSFIPSGALIKASLLNSTVDMTTIPEYPSDMGGWGLVCLDRVLYLPGNKLKIKFWDIRNKFGLSAGEIHSYDVTVLTSSQPLKITLVFNDPPPALSDFSQPIVNNLDLRVTSPNNEHVYFGNAIEKGSSTTKYLTDTFNNVEMVIVPNPQPGIWTIDIIGSSVKIGRPKQGYALVATADQFVNPSKRDSTG